MFLLTPLWLGFLTSITPCVFSASVAIISHIFEKSKNKKEIMTLSLLYVFGRIFLYTIISIILMLSIDSMPKIQLFLYTKLNIILGLLLIIVGLTLLDIINLSFLHFSFVEKIREKTSKSKYFSTFIFGVLLAGMFCPITASLFISNFIQNPKSIISFILYGFMTGFPAIVLSTILINTKIKYKRFSDYLDKFSIYSTKITGIIFLIIGILLIFKLF